MRFSTSIKAILFTVIASLSLNCNDSGSSSSTDSATIQGRVDDNNNGKISGTSDVSTVTAAYINAQGSVEAIEGTEVETDASGNFELAVNADMHQNIIVKAQSETQASYGYVSGTVENGNSYTVKPINAESSAETKVFAKLVASNESETVSKAEVEMAVNADAASEINSDVTIAAEVASSLSSAAEVRTEYIESESGSESSNKINALNSGFIEAQGNLNARLNASATAQERAQAYSEFRTDILATFETAGFESSSRAKVLEMWSRTYLNASASTESSVRNETYTELSLITAEAVDIAVKAKAENLDESTQSSIAGAGATLKTEIETEVSTAAEVRASFESYYEEVKTALENDSHVSATIVSEIDTQINSTQGAKTIFDASIAATVNSSVVVDVYTTFFTGVETTVENLTVNADVSTEVLAEIMIMSNLSS